ncbi:hypothetical protein [Niabella beijingensis]|nr:hypothetical protein [Niabella beijingensis]
MENQISIVLNFSLSVDFRFANAEPIVNTTMAVIINVMCIKP